MAYLLDIARLFACRSMVDWVSYGVVLGDTAVIETACFRIDSNMAPKWPQKAENRSLRPFLYLRHSLA